MAYRFKRGDSSVQDGLRRIALDQIDKAIAELDDEALGDHETVHQVRKRCKRLRALIRVVRPVFAGYKAENAALRDAAGALSFLRDTEALRETYDALLEAHEGRIERRAFAPVRRKLTLRRKALARDGDLEARLGVFRDRLHEARDRAAGWRLACDGFAALEGGLGKTYGRARKAMARARDEGSAEAFHDWRKRVKYHRHHARLLGPAWPGPMAAHHDAADRLGDLLGDHHDLAVFRDTLARDSDAYGDTVDIEALLGLAEARQAALAADAFALGARLLAEPRSALVARWGAWWTTWRDERAVRAAALAA